MRIQAVPAAIRASDGSQLTWLDTELVIRGAGAARGLGPAVAAALSPDGTRVATVRDGQVLDWDRSGAKGPRPAPPLPGVVDVAFDAAGRCLALARTPRGWMLAERSAPGSWTERFHGPGRPLGLGPVVAAGAAGYAPLALAEGLAVLRFHAPDPLLWWAGRAWPPELPPALALDGGELVAVWTRRTRVGWRLMAAAHGPARWPPHWVARTVAEGVGSPLGAGAGTDPAHLWVLTDRGALRGPPAADPRWEHAPVERANGWEDRPQGRAPLRRTGDVDQVAPIRRASPERR